MSGWLRRMVALLSVVFLLFSTSALEAQAGAAAAAPTASSQAQQGDPGWPRQNIKDGAKLVYYQPQVDSWDNYQIIKARMAFSLIPPQGKQAGGRIDGSRYERRQGNTHGISA